MYLNIGSLLLSTNKDLLQYEFIYEQYAQSYWASERPRAVIDRSIEHSLCFGVYEQNKQIAFARIITDYATTYYLSDLFVAEQQRGKGIAKLMLKAITEHECLSHLVGILGTGEAHGLYEQFGFVRNVDRMMVRRPKSL